MRRYCTKYCMSGTLNNECHSSPRSHSRWAACGTSLFAATFSYCRTTNVKWPRVRPVHAPKVKVHFKPHHSRDVSPHPVQLLSFGDGLDFDEHSDLKHSSEWYVVSYQLLIALTFMLRRCSQRLCFEESRKVMSTVCRNRNNDSARNHRCHLR